MTVSRKHVVFTAAIAGLIVLNILRWWPEASSGTDTRNSSVSALNPADFVVQGWAQDPGRRTPPRDLFFAEVTEPERDTEPAPPPEQAPPVETRMPTAQALARERAGENLAAYRLEGVLRRQGRWQAFLSKGDERFTVVRGAGIEGRIVVDEIDSDGIVLRDRRNNVKKRIQVNGKE